MNRRDLIKSASAAGLIAVIPKAAQSVGGGDDSSDPDHVCDSVCFVQAEALARTIIRETGSWKLHLYDWTKRVMVVTRDGQSACEIGLASPSHNPYWTFKRRWLTHEERESFQAEYGRSHWLLMGVGISETIPIRGFILNGRKDGWNLSTGTA